MLAQRTQETGKAVVKLRELSADEKTRDLYERREKERRDTIMHERWAVKQAHIEIAKRLFRSGDPVDKIIDITGLTRAEVDVLLGDN